MVWSRVVALMKFSLFVAHVVCLMLAETHSKGQLSQSWADFIERIVMNNVIKFWFLLNHD